MHTERVTTPRGVPGRGTDITPDITPLKGAFHMNLFVLRTWLQAKFGKDEAGASMVEYILLVALIALAVIAAVVFLKDQVNGKFNDAGSKLSSSGS
jgi:Flp pilus assembly pilin Flp